MNPSQPFDDPPVASEHANSNVAENYLRLLNHNPAVVTYVDAEQRYQFVNDAMAEWLGGKREDYIGQYIWDALGREAYETVKHEIERVLAGESVTYERLVPYKNGVTNFIRATYTPDIEDGRVIGYFGMIIDITDKYASDLALQRSEERYRAFIEQSTEGIWRCELREPIPLDISVDEQIAMVFRVGYLAECNNAMAAQYGFGSAADINGAPLDQLLIPEDPKNVEFLRAFIENGYSLTEAESHEKDASGRDVYFLNNFVGFIENGKLVRAWGTQRDITQRKKAEHEMAHLAAIVESSDDAIISKNVDGIITSWNKSAEKVFGYAAEEVIGQPVSILIPRDRIDEEPYILSRIRAGESIQNYETIRRRKDGTEIFISLTVSPIRDAAGRVIGASKIARDITASKKADEELFENQMMLSMAMQSSRMGAWEHDYATDVVNWSEDLEEIFGLSAGSFPGTRAAFYSLIHEDDRQSMWIAVENAIDAKRDYNVEFRFYHADGSIRWMEGRGQAVYSEKGQPVRLYGIGIDITERKRTEEALLAAERRAAEQYQALLSRIVPLAQTLGKTRDLLSVYRALREFIAISMPCSAFFVSSYNGETRMRTAGYVWGEEGEVDITLLPPILLTEDGGPNSQAVFQKRSVVVGQYMELMKDRTHVVLQDNGVDPRSSMVVPMLVMGQVTGTLEVQAYEDAAFTPEHIVALEMAANLTAVAIENVKLIEREIELRNQAEAANRTKDEFLSVLSHELRTPLNSMLGWTRMLRSGALEKESVDKAIEVIERNTRLQIHLIEDLLDVSRIISGKMRIEKSPLDLAALISDSVEAVGPAAEARKVSLEFAIPAGSMLIDGDAVRLQQVISNLADNAVKFTPEHGRVVISLVRSGNNAELSVSDSGIGIDPEFLPYIFDRFSQADASTRRSYAGLGLGLAIVRKIVELHGGTITADSEGPGRGATFTVSLPLVSEFYTEIDGAKLLENAGEENGTLLSGKRVMLVDDDHESLIPLRLFLEREDAEVFTANSADEALRTMDEHEFHLLISDIGMPVMDGYEFISSVRSRSVVPAIALTAYASSEDRQRVLASGFQRHFAKPLDFDELLEAACKLCGNR